MEKWKDLICKGKEVSISDPEATRFLITVQQAVSIILNTLKQKDATPYFVDMKSVKLKDLLEAMILKYSSMPISVTQIPLSSSENKHEKISLNSKSSEESEMYNIKELMDII